MTKKVDWVRVAEKLPWGTGDEDVKKRKELFRAFDPNGNGYLSLAEVDKGVCETLHLKDVFAPVIIIRAFNAAKSLDQKGKGKNDDFVERSEFRKLFLYLRQYLELYVMFQAIDTSKDGRIDEREFSSATDLLEKWGMTVDDPSRIFREIDYDNGGKILFDEFAHWAISQKLDLDDDDDVEAAGAGSGLINQPVVKQKTGTKKSTKSPTSANSKVTVKQTVGGKKIETKTEKKSAGGNGGSGTGNVDWGAIAKTLPWGLDDDATKKRKVLFRKFDPNGNGYLSLAEVDQAVVNVLKLGKLFPKCVIIRAFNAAKVTDTTGKNKNDDYVEASEFRGLLLYLRQYLELWVMFQEIDGSGDGRIDKDEFGQATMLLARWGVKVDDPSAVFAEIDYDQGGMILFDEFAHWAIQNHLDLDDDDNAGDGGAGGGAINTGPKIPVRLQNPGGGRKSGSISKSTR